MNSFSMATASCDHMHIHMYHAHCNESMPHHLLMVSIIAVRVCQV
jgi:hypothetical protein